MKGEKRLNQIVLELEKLVNDLDLGQIREEVFIKKFRPLRKEMAWILFNDAEKEVAEIGIEIKRMERDLEGFTKDALIIMANNGVKKSEKLVGSVMRTLKSAIKQDKKRRTGYLRVMKDESKYL